jgi:hypothetical protein
MRATNHTTHRSTSRNPLQGWIEAERRGDEASAERWFALALDQLPVPMPRPRFADRVLARAGLDRASRHERRRAWIVTLVLTALVGSFASIALWSQFAPSELVADLGSGLTRATEWFAFGLTVLVRVVRLGELARTVAATPESTAGLLGLVALAGLAWTFLAFLLERSRHVEA